MSYCVTSRGAREDSRIMTRAENFSILVVILMAQPRGIVDHLSTPEWLISYLRTYQYGYCARKSVLA
jgi:hypothetical protein